MRVNFVITFLCLVLATVLALPTDPNSLAARAIPPRRFYYGVTADHHQTNFITLSTAGYQIISLSVYGQPPNHRYAAIWEQRPGPSSYTIHEASGSAYQSFFDTHSKNGYVSTIVTVTGPLSAPIFAGVMEKNGVTNWYQLCGLTRTQYTTQLQNGRANHYILKSFSEYGDPSDRRYCGVWYNNDQLDNYTHFVDEDYTTYQDTINSETQQPFWRPSYLSVSEDHLISSTFVENDVGSWVARHGMTADDLHSETRKQLESGRYIIHLQGGGTGSDANYAALWSTQDIQTQLLPPIFVLRVYYPQTRYRSRISDSFIHSPFL